MDIKLVDNKGDNTLANLLLKEIKSGAKVAIASAYFSLYAYDALSKVLDKVESFNFIYTKPTFTKEEKDLKRQYHLNNSSHSRSASAQHQRSHMSQDYRTDDR